MEKITYTIQTKIFSENHAEDLEKSINNWLKDNNVKILDIHTSVYPMYDMYQQRAPEVCNSWEQYITTLIYHDEL
jgi:ADP-dependent phosphofructokinase/glucokinase